jgi:hypothetical protein
VCCYVIMNACFAGSELMDCDANKHGWMYDMDVVSFVLYTLSGFSNRQMDRFDRIREGMEDV